MSRRKGSKSSSNASSSSNPLLTIVHNKWRYYTRKHKSPPRLEVVFLLIVIVFFAINFVGKRLSHRAPAAVSEDCVDGLTPDGYICEIAPANGTEAEAPEATAEGGGDEAVEEELAASSGGPLDFLGNFFSLNSIAGIKARFHEWWTGDNPGYRQLSGETVPMEEREFSFDVDFLASAPNPRFVFHNKLPKTGSTTMHNIVGLLSRRNNFTYWKIMSGVMKFGDESTLVQALRMRYREPFFLLQHHYWMDFEKYDMVQPTFVNMIREPVTWFQSHYSFMKYGANSRKANSGVENLSKDIQECIKEEDKLCQGNPWTYIEFFCGSDKFCNQIKNGDDDAKAKVLDIAKRRVVHQYYVVGILEQFEDTLRMFETMLPDFYSGAMTAWRSDYIQFRRNQTKTIKGEPLDDASREFLAHNALKYESDFYWFCRFLFNERMRALQIEPSPNTNT